MEVTKVPLRELRPYDGNAKTHTAEQIEAVKASIRDFGFRNPIVAWHDRDGQAVIVAGHARARAAQELGMDKVPVVFCDDLTDAQRRGLTLADNQTTMMTGWDEDALAYELDVLSGELDMGDYGFDLGASEGEFGTEFDLPDEDGPGVSQMTFTVAPEQRDVILGALGKADTGETETFGNVNRNGNALYEVVTQWLAQKTSS